MVRFFGLVVLMLSPSPIACMFFTQYALEVGTVRWIERCVNRGQLILATPDPSATSLAEARGIWRDVHDVNFPLGLAFLLACASSATLATAGGLILLKSRRSARQG